MMSLECTQAYATVVAEENPTTADLFTGADPDPEEGESHFVEVKIPPVSTTAPKIDEADDDASDDDDMIIVEPESKELKAAKVELDAPCVPLSLPPQQLEPSSRHPPLLQTRSSSCRRQARHAARDLPRHVDARDRHRDAGREERRQSRGASSSLFLLLLSLHQRAS